MFNLFLFPCYVLSSTSYSCCISLPYYLVLYNIAVLIGNLLGMTHSMKLHFGIYVLHNYFNHMMNNYIITHHICTMQRHRKLFSIGGHCTLSGHNFYGENYIAMEGHQKLGGTSPPCPLVLMPIYVRIYVPLYYNCYTTQMTCMLA